MRKALGALVLGFLLFTLAAFLRPAPKKVTHVKHQVTKPWDGNPDHPDCSENGHPDPKHPGIIISDQYSDACAE